MRLIIIAVLALALSGCASLLGGGTYTFEKTSATQCTLEVNSNRQVEGQISVMVTDGCGINVTAGGVTQGRGVTSEDVQLLRSLLGGG